MQNIKVSEATSPRKEIELYLVADLDGKTPVPGVVISPGDLKVKKAGGNFVDATGVWSEITGRIGFYTYVPPAGELDTFGPFVLSFEQATIRSYSTTVMVVAFDQFDAAALGLSRLDAAVTTRATATDVNNLLVVEHGAGLWNGISLTGEIFYDRAVDIRGNALDNITVTVLEAGTATVLYTTQTDINGAYSVPLTGALATPILVDLRFTGGGIQTFTKQNVTLS